MAETGNGRVSRLLPLYTLCSTCHSVQRSSPDYMLCRGPFIRKSSGGGPSECGAPVLLLDQQDVCESAYRLGGFVAVIEYARSLYSWAGWSEDGKFDQADRHRRASW